MIILHVAMSVDGFIAGPEHDMSWTGGSEYSTASDIAATVAGATGAVLAGRGWYDLAIADEGGAVAGIYGGDWSGSVVVVTHRPHEIVPELGLETAADLETGLTRAKELAGTKDVGVFGGNLARQILERGWLDEIIVQVVPVVLGGGVPLFGAPPGPRVTLHRTHAGTSGQLTDMRFRVLRA